MKHIFTKIFLSCAILSPIFTFILPLNAPAYADASFNGECNYFLGLTSWDCGVDISDEKTLKEGILQIVVNISTDISVIAAYLLLGYVIYGGYLYMFSSGDAGKVAAGKKTLANAFIGFGIAIGANVILTSIRIAMLGGGALSGCTENGGCINAGDVVNNLVNWVIGIAGITSAIFVVVGGVGYITSSGDAGKLQKAKNTIFYALIGLGIVALAEIITTFVSGMIRGSL